MIPSRGFPLLESLFTGDPITDLATLTRLRNEGEKVEAVLVRTARNQAKTWAEIASALGVTRQAAHKKHGGSRLRS